MAITINENSVTALPAGAKVRRQPLLTAQHTKDGKVLLDRMSLDAGGAHMFSIANTNLAWIQILDGEAVLTHAAGVEQLSSAHIVLLPPEFGGVLSTPNGVELIHAAVPNAARFDPAFTSKPPKFTVVDWTCEPVLDSEHDARKRIYVATPMLFGTKAIKGEMIIYPPGTEASNHHHEGAEHFMYVLKGRGTVFASELPIPVRKGDLIYYADHERHYLRCEGDEEMAFVEFFVPGEYKTVWAPGAPVCTWTPAGRSLSGTKPVRHIARHSSASAVSPGDV